MFVQEKKIRVLELFSGIGGMHFSLSKAKLLLKKLSSSSDFQFEVVAALDINEGANFGNEIKF